MMQDFKFKMNHVSANGDKMSLYVIQNKTKSWKMSVWVWGIGLLGASCKDNYM